jgi:hypothetical protein
MRYHADMCLETTTGSATESAVDSELTEEYIFYQLSYCLCLRVYLARTI